MPTPHLHRSYAWLFSLLIHVGMMLLVFIGLPHGCHEEPPSPPVITVELLPVRAQSNVAPQHKTAQPKPEEKPKPAKEVKTAQEPPPAPVPPTPKPETKPEIKPTPKPEITPTSKPTPPLPEKKPTPEEKPKDNPKPQEKPKENPKKKPQKSELDSLLKTLEEPSVKTKTESKKPQKELKEEELFPDQQEETTEGPHDPSKELSISEIDLIRTQIEKCWIVPSGIRDAGKMKVTLHMQLSMDGTVSNVSISRSSHYDAADADLFRAASENAVRAVQQCSPLQNLPADKYNNWKELELNFDPKEML